MILTADEYDSWRCDDDRICDLVDCKPTWQNCECVLINGVPALDPDPDCEDCGGSGGGHICANENSKLNNTKIRIDHGNATNTPDTRSENG